MGWNSLTTSHWPQWLLSASPGCVTLLKVRTWMPKGRELWAQHLPSVCRRWDPNLADRYLHFPSFPHAVGSGCGQLSPSARQELRFFLLSPPKRISELSTEPLHPWSSMLRSPLGSPKWISLSQGQSLSLKAFFHTLVGLSLKTGYGKRRGKWSHIKILLQMIKHSQLKASWKL